MNANQVRQAQAEASKNIITCDVNDTMTVRIYTKSRAKGEIKFSKKRISQVFKSTTEANTSLDELYIQKGSKIRKVEVIAQDGTVQLFRPAKIRLTPTPEQKAEAKALKQVEREAQRKEKAEAEAKAKAAAEKAKAKAAADKEKAKKAEAVKKAAEKQAAKTPATEKALA
jgi:colicin import membrane protein